MSKESLGKFLRSLGDTLSKKSNSRSSEDDNSESVQQSQPPSDMSSATLTSTIRSLIVKSKKSVSLWSQHRHYKELGFLSAKYESLDYAMPANALQRSEDAELSSRHVRKMNGMWWIVIFVIGVLTALLAFSIDAVVDELCALKFKYIQKSISDCTTHNCMLVVPFISWLAMNAIPSFIGSLIIIYGEPAAAGSGIPWVKCYLNGVKIPHVTRIKTLFVKSFGVTLAEIGGLAVGKEGPMIHCGSVIAAGISQGISSTFKHDFGILHYFRNDRSKRDFVSAGAASGVAAAFGAPIAGILFSLEEGTSFWNETLTWKIFFGCIVSALTVNLAHSALQGHPGNLIYSGLLRFGPFDTFTYEAAEIPIFLIMGVIGGLLGAFYNYLNFKITVFRIRYMYKGWIKMTEVVFVAVVTAAVGICYMILMSDCQPNKVNTEHPVKMDCPDGQHNSVASLWMSTPRTAIMGLLRSDSEAFRWSTLLMFSVTYFLLGCWTYGLTIASGLFMPTLLIGAGWGRLFGVAVGLVLPKYASHTHCFALVGAAAQVAGVVRMTISLVVLLMEATGSLDVGLPLMFVVMVARWVGNFFNDGIYQIHLELTGIPVLSWDPPSLSSGISASQVMNPNVVTLKRTETVKKILGILRRVKFNGFPIVEDAIRTSDNSFGCLCGLILRWQLVLLLKHRLYLENEDERTLTTSIKLFRDAYPRYPTLQQIHVSEDDLNLRVNLDPFMNETPYTISPKALFPRVYALFRALGMRHLVAVNNEHQVVGMITRKDLARFHEWDHRGSMGLQELIVIDEP